MLYKTKVDEVIARSSVEVFELPGDTIKVKLITPEGVEYTQQHTFKNSLAYDKIVGMELAIKKIKEYLERG